MSNPAFLVDGFMEKLVLGQVCPNKKVNRINCNGNSVSIEAMAKRISSLISLLNNRYYPIIILVDREDRDITCLDFERALLTEIRSNGITDDVRIGVCDRMIENWILSDWETFCSICGTVHSRPEEIEGLMGKSLIKRFYGSYHETTDGVSLFLKSNPATIYANSPSFRSLADKLADIECDWISLCYRNSISLK